MTSPLIGVEVKLGIDLPSRISPVTQSVASFGAAPPGGIERSACSQNLLRVRVAAAEYELAGRRQIEDAIVEQALIGDAVLAAGLLRGLSDWQGRRRPSWPGRRDR